VEQTSRHLCCTALVIPLVKRTYTAICLLLNSAPSKHRFRTLIFISLPAKDAAGHNYFIGTSPDPQQPDPSLLLQISGRPMNLIFSQWITFLGATTSEFTFRDAGVWSLLFGTRLVLAVSSPGDNFNGQPSTDSD